MQLHALDNQSQIVSARRALRQTNYLCPECKQHVRLRSGPHRQPHFFHLEPPLSCRQHQKGEIHLQLQAYFQRQLPVGDCQIECPFPTVGRIADVAWLSRKIVFEIQYSAIRAEEVMARNRDYRKAGWEVVWVLHDKRYNQLRVTAAEAALRPYPHLYSNMDAIGRGVVYDQFDMWDCGIRKVKLAPLPIDLKEGITIHPLQQAEFPLRLLELRAKNWPFYFPGDLMGLFQIGSASEYFGQAQEWEKKEAALRNLEANARWSQKIWQCAMDTYRLLFRFFLERSCR